MMKSFFEGRLVHDLELRSIDTSNTCMCNVRLACNEYRKHDGDTNKYTHYFDFEIWDSGARTLSEKAKKGDIVTCIALPRQQRWKDKETQKDRSRVVFRIEEFSVSPRVSKEEIS